MTRWRTLACIGLLAGLGILTGCDNGYYVAGISTGPPAPIYGAVGAPPGPGYVWMDGYYNWSGRWVWVPGRWVRPPYPHAVWVRPRWEHHRHGYRFHDGHWRGEHGRHH